MPIESGKLRFAVFIATLFLLTTTLIANAAGPLRVNASGQWFETAGDQKPYFMAGLGGPEGFLYETTQRKQQIVDQLIQNGGNAVYMHTIRAFGGDGGSSEHPFNANDPASGIKPGVFDNWMLHLRQLDAAAITTWIHVLDDTARPWGCSLPLPGHAKTYIRDLVNRFKSLNHLVWLSGEEYLMGACSDAQDKALMQAIAAEIRLHDKVHPVGVHHNSGQQMQFGGDPNINVFAQQTCGSASTRSVDGLHGVAQRGPWVYVMAECHPWHRDLLARNDRDTLRQSAWATTLAGGYFLLYDAYERSTGTAPHDPSVELLRDLRTLTNFMNSTPFNTLNPRDDLATGGTRWVLANPATRKYILFSNQSGATLSVRDLAPGNYALTWLDAKTGQRLVESRSASQVPFTKPPGFGNEVALYLDGNGTGVTPQPSAVQAVNSFTVVNADTGTELVTVTSAAPAFAASSSVSIASTPRINIRANVSNTSSVVFTEGSSSRTESAAPYAFAGDSGGVYTPWTPAVGVYVIKATPFSASGGTGMAGRVATLTLTVTAGSTQPPNPGTAGVSHRYPANSGPAINPHKGWNSGWFSAQPESSVGFQYLAWKDFEPTNGTFDFNKVEEILARAGSKGKHFVLRLYCDWHHSKSESDCPAWMYSQVGVRRLNGDGGAKMTDFNDAKYLDQAVQAIQALAQRYDGDPRVHAFQLGILGNWGEWHTHGFEQNGVDYTISAASQNRILQAYKTYFTKSPLQGRYPWREPMQSAGFIGYHNDFFLPNNGHSKEFDTALAAGGQWRNGPIGGEVPPRSSSEAASEKRALFTGVGQNMIQTGHYTTMKPGSYRVTEADPNYADYLRLHRLMGYNFRIDQAVFADTLSAAQSTLPVRLDARNIGVARLYRPWAAEFALLDAQGRVLARTNATASVNLGEVVPDGTFTLSAPLNRAGVAAGSYRLAVRLIQPGAGVAKPKSWGLDARNAYIQFANDLSVIDGQWAADHSLVGGWSVLGSVQLF